MQQKTNLLHNEAGSFERLDFGGVLSDYRGMHKQIVSLVIFVVAVLALFLSDNTLSPCHAESKSSEIVPLGEVPVTVGKDKAPEEAKKQKKDIKKKDVITKRDHQYYQRAGHRSPKWDEFIEPAFQTFDGGNLSTAYIFLQRAYDRGCRDPLVLFRLGIFKESREQYGEAATLFSETAKGVAKRYPKHPLATGIHEHAARALYRMGNVNGALTEITEAIKNSPDDFMLLFMAGQILNEMKEYARARIILEKALVAPRPDDLGTDAVKPLLYELMAATFETGDYDACKAYVERMLAIDPADAVANNYRQQVETKLKWHKESEILRKLGQ